MATEADVRDLLRAAACRMGRPGGEEAAVLEADLLMAHALNVGREWLYAHPDARPSEAGVAAYERMVGERAESRCPVAYLIGRREFCGIDLRIERGVFIPRPETEGLVELFLAEWERRGRRAGGVVAEVGCGSGAVAVALARALNVRLVATDISEKAVALTGANAAAAGVGDLVDARIGRGLQPLAGIGLERVDAIVSNPPYVSTGAIAGLDPGVKDFEPMVALDGGPDGVDVIREIVAEAGGRIVPGGFLAIEIGADQGDVVLRLLREGGWRDARIERDLAGFQRYALAFRPGEKGCDPLRNAVAVDKVQT